MKEACAKANQKKYPFILPDLPFGEMDLEPYMSEKTFAYHYHKHHNAYVINLNKLLENSNFKDKSLEEIIILSSKDEELKGIFNNAAQVWNHSFFWHCLDKKNGGGSPHGAISSKITSDFGSFENFSKEFKNAALTQFGSGWAWLVINENGKLEVMKTSNADLPMAHNKKALLTIDVWEHAYYLDFQNLRPNYVDTFLQYLVNWDFVNEMLNS